MTEMITSPGMADLSSPSLSTADVTPSDVTPVPIADAEDEVVPAESPDDADGPDPITKSVISANFLPRWTQPDLLDLTLGNYRRWERRILHVLTVSGELALYLDPEYICPERTTKQRILDARAWIHNDRLVQSFIRVQCSDAEADHLPDKVSAGALWVFLRERHLNRGPHAQVLLLRDLLRLRFDESKPLAPQAHESIKLCRQIITMGQLDVEALSKVAILHMMRDTLPQIQRSVADALSCATIDRPYTTVDIIKRLELEQTFRDDSAGGGVSTDVALSAQQAGRGNGRIIVQCSNCKRQGHAAADCFQPNGAMAGRREEVEAKIAARHAKRLAKAPGAAPAVSAAQPAGTKKLFDAAGKVYYLAETKTVPALAQAHSAVVLDDCGVQLPSDFIDPDSPPDWLTDLEVYSDAQYEAYAACLEVSADWSCAYSAQSPGVEPFLFDSGASTHISPLRDDFFELEDIAPRGIKGVNGSIIYATGMGKIRLSVGADKHLVLERALLVPDASVRLISVRALCDGPHGYKVAFDCDGVSILHRTGELFFSGIRVGNGLFSLSGPPPAVDSAYVVSRVPTLETWHRRLGHANYRATYKVAVQARATGTPVNLSVLPPKCDSCILGKQTRSTVPDVREGVRSTERGSTFFVDAAGTYSTRSASGNVVPLDIIDDFSSYAWTFPVPSKAHCAPRLRAFLIARRTEGCPVRRVVMDGGECLTGDIKAVCDELGIDLQLTAADTSAQNGKAERVHRTFLGKSRSMRLAAGVPENRWDEFYITACYLSNRTPSSSLPKGVSPYEVWFGKAPDLRHLREIGCRVFPLITTHNPKLRARSFECVLIGYGSNSKTYRCYHRSTHRVISSFHVSFIESHESGDSCPSPSSAPPPPPSPPVPTPIDDSSPSSPTFVESTWTDDPVFTPSKPHTSAPPPPSLLPPSIPLPSRSPSPAASAAPPPPVVPTPPPPASPSHDHVIVLPPPTDSPPQRSSRVRAPSARCAAASGLPRVSALERAVAECKESTARAKAERIARADARVEDDIALFSGIDLALAATLQLDSDYDGDPTSLRDAMASSFASEWRVALEEEFKSILDMGVYKLIPRRSVPAKRRIMHGKPVFRLKRDENGAPVRFKARWVCKGYEAVWGQDYYSTTSPTMRLESFRVLLHLGAALDWSLLQIDVKTAFLYGTLPENEICYMEQPRGFEVAGKEDWVWELHKGLYGMPQGGRTWNRTMHQHLVSVGFERVPSEYCLYFRTTSEGTVITGVHVDDFIAIASTPAAGSKFKDDLRREWTISDLGEARFCIGISIERDRATRSIRISQTALIDRIVTQFGLSDAYPVATPLETGCNLTREMGASTPDEKLAASSWPYRALVGSLNYVAVGSRPDISYAVQQLSQFLDCYGHEHWEAAKRVVRYLKGTRTLSLHLGGDRPAFLLGYTDSNHARCLDSRRSVGGYCFSLGTGMVSWSARKQATPADSSTEAEYMAAAEAAKECVWLRSILLAIGFPQTRPSPLSVDNASAITLTSDQKGHSRTKHIDIKHHIIRDYVATDQVFVHWIPTHDNTADIFTKPLPGPHFAVLRGYLGLS
ncbi:Copia protein [Trametes pubescens]|uniref:Copia protein n=1 Tax=Trametes pubescens TaxID=154538 RepID=A0A1M2VD65_TRAPU|nr:Copia protein [Trametes pubescens]